MRWSLPPQHLDLVSAYKEHRARIERVKHRLRERSEGVHFRDSASPRCEGQQEGQVQMPPLVVEEDVLESQGFEVKVFFWVICFWLH